MRKSDHNLNEYHYCLDLEFTGLHKKNSSTDKEPHRITEIGIVEMRGNTPTGKTFHTLINPEREVTAKASKMSGLFNKDLYCAPLFKNIAQQMIDFIGDHPIIIHCVTSTYQDSEGYECVSSADEDFLNYELHLSDNKTVPSSRFINQRDWLYDIHGQYMSLDETLTQYRIERSLRRQRKKEGHSALLDARLLSMVFPRVRTHWENGWTPHIQNAQSSIKSFGSQSKGNNFFDHINLG